MVSNSKKFVFIKVNGSPYECGYKHGSKVKNLIKQNLSYYFNYWEKRFNLKKETILRKAEKIGKAVEKFDPSIFEELKGVADGSETSLSEIITLNSRYEFVWVTTSRVACTSVLTLPEATVNKNVLLGQNWDYKPSLLEGNILLKIEQTNGPNIVTHVEAGCIGRNGFNSKGIGLCINALVSSNDKFEPKVPFHVLCRSILNSESLSEAVGRIVSSERSLSYNFLIACSEGVAVDIELLPGKSFNYILPEDGFIIHTNHFLKVKMFDDEFIKVIPDTLVRYQRVKNMLKSKEKIDYEDLINIFRDHVNYPNSICRHPDPKLNKDDQLATLSSIIMDLNKMKMLITKGQPCKTSYQKLELG